MWYQTTLLLDLHWHILLNLLRKSQLDAINLRLSLYTPTILAGQISGEEYSKQASNSSMSLRKDHNTHYSDNVSNINII